MYSARLENLIKGALADGVLEDREIAVLRRVAAEEGVEPDELQMDVEARLAELRAKSADKQKVGNVRKCPMCGAVLSGVEGSCPECGHIITGIAAVSSAKAFADGLQKIAERKAKGVIGSSILSALDLRLEENTFIKNFPVPNTAEDLFEFMIVMYNGRGDQYLGDAYKSKFNECYQKASLLFPNHPTLSTMQQKMKLNWFSRQSRAVQVLVIYGILMLVGGLIAIICAI